MTITDLIDIGFFVFLGGCMVLAVVALWLDARGFK